MTTQQSNQEQDIQNISITDYLRIIYRGRWIIVFSFLAVFSATIYYTFTTAPIYEASTSIIIDQDGAMQSSLFDFGTFSNQNTHIQNQIEIIKSRTLAERVVRRLELSDVRDSLNMFKPNERGEFRTLRQMASSIRGNLEVINKKDTDIIEIIYQSGSPFEAAYIVNVVAEEFQNSSAEFNRGEIRDLRNFLEDQLAKKGQELGESEELLRNYQENNRVASLDAETSELVTRMAQVEAQLEQARVELQTSQQMKASVQKQLDLRKETLPADLSEISTPYLITLQNELANQVAERTKFVTAIETEAQAINRQYYQSSINKFDERIDAIKEKLREEANKISASNMLKDPFQLSQNLVTQLLTIEAEIQSLTAKITALQDVVNSYDNELQNLPVKVLDLARLQRRREVDEQTYIMMTTKLEETKIQEAGQRQNVRPVDKAIEPLEPTAPKKRLNLALGLVLGLGLGVGITFLREYFDNTIKTQEDLEHMGFNILATIPKIEMSKVEKKMESRLSKLGPLEGRRIEARLITHLDPKSPVSEAYRTLRTNLQFSRIDSDVKTVLITSSGPKEGKSTTSANLAIALAQSGKKVILIDGDLRRPVVHSIFGLEKDNGLTNYLMNDIAYEKMIRSPLEKISLSVITSGVLPPNPSELLSSSKMEELIQRLKNDFDIVLFDTPPIIAVTDAALLSTKVDGTILVVSAGHTNYDAVVRAKSLMDNVKAHILGALLNGVDVGGLYGSYYYYYYHHYYSRPAKKGRKRL